MAVSGNYHSSEPSAPHRLTIDERRRLEVTGVKEVLRFDDQAVELHTVRGLLVLRGEKLRLLTLVPDSGRVCVEGVIDALAYEAPRESGGFWKRLFG